MKFSTHKIQEEQSEVIGMKCEKLFNGILIPTHWT